MAIAALRNVPILMYHQITEPGEPGGRLAVSAERFAQQMAYLADAGFQTLTAVELSAAMAGDRTCIPDRTVVLTFDDGYADFHSRAMPVLERFGFKATLFVTSGWVRSSGPGSGPASPSGPAGRMLSWGQLTEAVSAGVEIGGHTCQHPQLDQLPARLIRQELRTSKAVLEDRLGVAVPGLAYPYGYCDARVRRAASEAGYAYAHAVRNRLAPAQGDPFAVPRLTVRRATTLAAFGRMVHGATPLTIRQDRVLTAGWAVVRRGKRHVASRRWPADRD